MASPVGRVGKSTRSAMRLDERDTRVRFVKIDGRWTRRDQGWSGADAIRLIAALKTATISVVQPSPFIWRVSALRRRQGYSRQARCERLAENAVSQ